MRLTLNAAVAVVPIVSIAVPASDQSDDMVTDFFDGGTDIRIGRRDLGPLVLPVEPRPR